MHRRGEDDGAANRKQKNYTNRKNEKVSLQVIIWIGIIVVLTYIGITLFVISRSDENTGINVGTGTDIGTMGDAALLLKAVGPEYDLESLLMEGMISKPRVVVPIPDVAAAIEAASASASESAFDSAVAAVGEGDASLFTTLSPEEKEAVQEAKSLAQAESLLASQRQNQHSLRGSHSRI